MSDTQVKEPQMPDFVGWCNHRSLELPTSQEAVQEEQPESEKADASENRKRTGAKEGLYPVQYFAGQYPALWKIPAAADSHYYQSINKKLKQ